jgi:hypothetical protein
MRGNVPACHDARALRADPSTICDDQRLIATKSWATLGTSPMRPKMALLDLFLPREWQTYVLIEILCRRGCRTPVASTVVYAHALPSRVLVPRPCRRAAQHLPLVEKFTQTLAQSSRTQALSSRRTERRPQQPRCVAHPPGAKARRPAGRIRAGRSALPVSEWSRRADLPDFNA